jgi:hypothetical protein
MGTVADIQIARVPSGLRAAAAVRRQLVPRHQVVAALEGLHEQLTNVADLLATGRAAEAGIALADVSADLKVLIREPRL